MTKKILSLLLSLAMILPMFVMSASAATVAEGYTYATDFEDYDSSDYTMSAVNATIETIDGQGSVLKLNPTSTSGQFSKDIELPEKYTIEFDMMTTNDDACIVIHWHDDEAPAGYTHMSALIQKISMVHGVWYDYKVEVDTTNLSTGANGAIRGVTVYRRVKGTETWDACPHLGANYLNANYGEYTPKSRHFLNRTTVGSANSIGFSFTNSYYPNAVIADTVYYIDNFRLNTYENSFVGEVWFEDANGDWTQTIPDGDVTPVYQLENYGGLTSATAVTAVYDADNKMVASNSTDIILDETAATVEVEGAAVDASIVGEGGRIEAYLWDDNAPVGSTYGVLGTSAATASSETTAAIGEASDAVKSNSFTALDRSTYADAITIEGKHSTEAVAVVTIKAVGKQSGTDLILSQFKATADGSFSRSFLINPELCADDTAAIVTVSGYDTTAQTFEIPVFSNWDAMISGFADADTDTELEEYIAVYADNISYYESGETEITATDVTDISYSEMAFIKSMNTYAEDMTNAEIVETVLGLIADTRAAETFVADFAAAKELETEAEKIAAIKALITETDIFTFSTEGVSNVDAICKELISSDAATIQDIYADFKAAYLVQKSAEEATVPGFTSITSGAEMKQFFADNEVVLGVDPEKYTDNDYNVMYIIYEEKAYSELTTYEAVNEAIVFLDSYINEYNQFMALITDAATVAENWETIRTLLNNTYNYIEIDLADETAVVNKEYLYKRLIDMDCTSLWTVEEAFENAVAAQNAYEISAKDALITITDATSIKAYFAEYADMIGVPDAKNYTDAELEVFVEVYGKFTPAAVNYSEAITKTSELIAKHATAMKLIDDINAKAEAADWTGIKALYEGTVSEEYLGISVDTSAINDIRSMYRRIANVAPYATLADLVSAWNTAYADQQSYEAVSGGYETFEDEKYSFDESVWKLTVSGNVVNVVGKVDGNGNHNLALYVEDEPNHPIYLKQLVTEAKGNFEITFILNPDKYDASKQATLRIGGDGVNIYTFAPFDLYGADELETVIDDFLAISNKTDMKNFFETYSETLEMSVDTEDDRVIEALYFLYDRNKDAGLYDDITDIDEIVNGTDGESGALALMQTMERMIQCLEDLTAAANEKVGSGTGRWKNIKTQVELAMKEGWISPVVSGKISSESSMYLKMAKKDYDYMSEVESAYVDAFNEQKEEEKKPASTGGGGGVGGGGSFAPSTGNGSDGKVQTGAGTSLDGDKDEMVINTDYYNSETVTPNLNQPDHPEAPFKDVTAEYSWASENINDLRKFGLVRGDGNGNFRPGDGISREEFLTILLNVFGVERDTKTTVPFADVKSGEWYYATVATAYKMGIVTGYNDSEFGIGDTISRADMAVMICRAMEVEGMSLDPTEEAFVFNDFTEIPSYAYQQVSKLQQAGVLNGDTFGYYNPNNDVTRAESAVALWAVFDRIKDFVYYSWEKVY